MKLLFLSYHYPGLLEPLARWLAARGHEILFASIRSARVKDFIIPGIRRVIVKHSHALADSSSFIDNLDKGIRIAGNTANSLTTIRETGFVPEIIFTASSGGSALAIPEVFPNSLWLNFLDSNLCEERPYADNMIQILQVIKAYRTYALYPSQKLFMPEVLQPLITSMPPAVDTRFFTPPESRTDQRLAIFCCCTPDVASMFVKKFLSASKSNRGIILAPNIPALRILTNRFSNNISVTLAMSREERKDLFSKANIAFFEQPCTRLLECMACGCPTFVSANSFEADRPAQIHLAKGAEISNMLDDFPALREYGVKLREIAVANYSLETFMPGWFKTIREQAKN